MATPRFCISNCVFLSPTEEEQHEQPREGRSAHYCSCYKLPVFHGPYHPKIMRVLECDVEIEMVSLKPTSQAQII